jgi:hypothetical protein
MTKKFQRTRIWLGKVSYKCLDRFGIRRKMVIALDLIGSVNGTVYLAEHSTTTKKKSTLIN